MSIQKSTKPLSLLLRTVKRQFGDESGAQITNEDITTWANLGCAEIATQTRWNKKISEMVTTGAETYSFPAANSIEIDAFLFDGRPLEFRNFQEHSKFEEIADTGTPAYWTNYGSAMFLVPNPAEGFEVKIFYSELPPSVDHSSDILPIPDKYYESLIDYVLARAYELDEDLSIASSYQSKYLSRLSDTTNEEANQQNIAYPTISILE